MKKKVVICSELAYFAALSLIALSVAMHAAADFGISMIAASTYILSLKFTFLTFGQWEYVVQGLLFVFLCYLLRGFKPVYLVSFVSSLIYGTVLDLWRALIPVLNPSLIAPGSMDMVSRLGLFIVGQIICGIAVALCFKVYIYPQVYDFFVKAVAAKRNIDRTKLKRIFDASFLALGLTLSLLLFHGFKGIGIGTVVLTIINGPVIGFFDKWLDKFFVFEPKLKKFSEYFV